MGHIRTLDCTLRDGGYCNQWKFGNSNAKRIVQGLVDANIDIIECGFITNKVSYDPNITKFETVQQVASIIPENRKGKIFVAMMNYGEYEPEQLPKCDGSTIDGIRVAFNKKNMVEALDVCKEIKDKGYKVFIQAMVSLSYTDEEFLDMIHRVNDFEPYAFYIVDSFGMMKQKDLIRLFYLVEHNLKNSIIIGFHSHNNLQLAYSNAQSLVDMHSERDMIIDSSIHGMGRGAGNLNTELFVQYLNEHADGKYEITPLLTIIDDILNEFYQKNYWGYSLPNYLSAMHNAHPNYAGFLDDKKTLTVEDMNNIFEMMDDSKKVAYDKAYAEKLYYEYMNSGNALKRHEDKLKIHLEGKKVLLVLPGKSSVEEKDKIIEFANQKDVVTISVNFDYPFVETNYIFLSNLRRYKEFDESKIGKCIITSNIKTDVFYVLADYSELLNDVEAVRDNAGLMAIKFLMNCGVKEILLAGMDGYSHDIQQNFGYDNMQYLTRDDVLDATNIGMESALEDYVNKIHIEFLTKPKNIIIKKS